MPLPEFTKRLVEARLRKYCHDKVPNHSRQKIKIHFKFRGNTVTLYESRPYHLDPSIWTDTPVTRFQYTSKNNEWSLHFADRNSKWHPYERIKPSVDFDVLLKELDKDPTGIFWG